MQPGDGPSQALQPAGIAIGVERVMAGARAPRVGTQHDLHETGLAAILDHPVDFRLRETEKPVRPASGGSVFDGVPSSATLVGSL